jgi:hypothetical protein
MRGSFPSRDQLSGMSIQRLRLIDIQEKDEELLVQEILDAKLTKEPPAGKVFRGDIPDIYNGEDEAKYQKVIDERVNALKPKTEVKIESKIEPIVSSKVVEPIKEGFKCNECGKVVKTEGALRMHKGKFHKK